MAGQRMALLGTNVPRDGTGNLWEIGEVYPNGVIRLVLMPHEDLNWYFDQANSMGLLIWAVIANESIGDMTFEQAAVLYKERYLGKIDFLQVGNEWDHVSGSSWTLTPGELYDLVWNFRNQFRRTVPIILGGAVSGNPDFLDAIRRTLEIVDGVSIHPYGQRAYENEPAPSGDFGLASQLFERYQARLASLGFSVRLYVSEWGVSSDEVGEGSQASYCGRFATMLRQSQAIEIGIHFCHHAYAGFGERREVGGKIKPVRQSLKAAVEGQQPYHHQVPVEEPTVTYPYTLGIKAKYEQLKAAGVDAGLALEPETYPYPGSPYSYQFTENGKFEYSAKANKVHFFKGS